MILWNSVVKYNVYNYEEVQILEENRNKNLTNKVTLMQAIVFILALVSVVSFVLAPMGSDIRVFFGAANQTSYARGNFITAPIRQWELKGIANRSFYYWMYLLVKPFAGFGTFAFEKGAKLLYVALACLAGYVCSRNFYNKEETIPRTVMTLGMVWAVTATDVRSHMQAEMSVVVLLTVAFALACNAVKDLEKINKIKLVVAGILVGLSFFFKSPLILMSLTVACGVLLFTRLEAGKTTFSAMGLVVIAAAVTLGVGLALIYAINPTEFKDIRYASLYESSLLNSEWNWQWVKLRWLDDPLLPLLKMPALLVGAVLGLYGTITEIRTKHWGRLCLRIIMWAMPFAFMILSNVYYEYHFVTLLLPSLMEMIIHWEMLREVMVSRVATIGVYVHMGLLIVLVFVAFAKPDFFYNEVCGTVYYLGVVICAILTIVDAIKNHSWGAGLAIMVGSTAFILYQSCLNGDFYKDYHVNSAMYAMDSADELIEDNSAVLFLDDGAGAYHINNRSYLRYFFPLPLVRIDAESENANLDVYKDMKAEILAFDGRYVCVYEDWFFGRDVTRNQEIYEKLKTEYVPIGSFNDRTENLTYFAKTSDDLLNTITVYERK